MQSQRVSLSSKLRESVHGDDITSKMVSHKNDDDAQLEALFKKELEKFDPQLKVLRLNLKAQENIVRALTESNAGYAATRRRVAAILTERTEKLNELLESKAGGGELLAKADRALDFYQKLAENVCKLLKGAKAATEVIRQKRDADLAKLRPAVPKPTLAGPPSAVAGVSPGMEKLTLRDVIEPAAAAGLSWSAATAASTAPAVSADLSPGAIWAAPIPVSGCPWSTSVPGPTASSF